MKPLFYLCFILTTTASLAEGYSNQSPTIIVTASRLPQSIADVAYPSEIITTAEIEAAQPQTLTELLQARAGVEIVSNGGPGQPAGIRLRGSETRHTLVLIDGIRVDSATTGATAIEHIPLNQIERIEVVHGPLSSLYGSDAIGGVVQIFTKKTRSAHSLYANLGIGQLNTYNASAGISHQFNDLRFNLNAGIYQTEGFSATNAHAAFGHNPDKDGYRNRNVSSQWVYTPTASSEWGMSLFQNSGLTHFDSSNDDDISHQTISGYAFYSHQQWLPQWKSKIKLAQGNDRYEILNSPTSIQTKQNQLSWENELGTGQHRGLIGVEYLDQHVASDTLYSQTQRQTTSLFSGYTGKFDRHAIQASLRYDENSQFGHYATGSIAYSYLFAPEFKATLALANAFKAPTFNDLYYPFLDFGYGYSYSGNPSLRPEKSVSREFSLHYQQANQSAQISLFDNRITDLITNNGEAASMPININQARIYGLQTAYRREINGLNLQLKFTLQKPENSQTNQRLRQRATRFGSLLLSKQIDRWSLIGEWVVSGARFDSNTESAASRMGGYGILNLSTQYKMTKQWTISGRLTNLFDKEYELAKGYNTTPRNIFISSSYQY